MSRHLLALLPAVGLLAVAGWSLLEQRAEEGNVATDAEWEAARDVVRAGFHEGDIIRTAPHWADSGRVGLFEYPFENARAIEEENLYFYDRLWLLADQEHVDDAIASLPEGWPVAQRWDTSPHTAVVLVDIPPPDNVLLDVVSDLPSAVVTQHWEDHVQDCTVWQNDTWYCGQVDPWLRVNASEEEIGNSLRRCLFIGLHPAELHITWRGVELGSRVVGGIGNIMASVRSERGGDIDFHIEIDGETVHAQHIGKWDQQLFPFDVDTSGLTGPHDLTFAVRTDDLLDRWVCMRGRVLR